MVSRRHDSLGRAGAGRCSHRCASCRSASDSAFAALGAWLVLPYCALEMAVLYWALRWIERHASDWEQVSVCGDRVIVERERAGVRMRQEFNRYWARVEVEDGGFNRPPRLKLRFAGRDVPFGEELPAAQRQRVARDLHRVLALR